MWVHRFGYVTNPARRDPPGVEPVSTGASLIHTPIRERWTRVTYGFVTRSDESIPELDTTDDRTTPPAATSLGAKRACEPVLRSTPSRSKAGKHMNGRHAAQRVDSACR